MSGNPTGWKGGKRATFQRLIVGSEVHDAFLRWVRKQYTQNMVFAKTIVDEGPFPSPEVKSAAFSVLLEKVASPLIYLEMDWHNLPDKEKVTYARGAYAEQLARRLQAQNKQHPIEDGTPSW